MERNDVTMRDGREYVSMEEFCRRLDISRSTFEDRVRLGLIPITKFDGRRKRYVDWELGKKAYYIKPAETSKRNHTNEKKRNDSYTKAEEHVTPPSDKPLVPKIDSGLEMKMERIVDISSIDPEVLKDCTINGSVDWDLAKKKLTALTYAFDLEVKKGKYVEKSEVQRWALSLAKILESALSSIPNRYAAILEAEIMEICQRETRKPIQFTDEDKSRIRAHMVTVAPDIFRSIQSNLEEFDDN